MRRALVALLLVAAAGCSGGSGYPPGRMLIATGGHGGVYYVYGQGLANVIRADLPGLDAKVLVTAASVENLQLIASGGADAAFTLADSAAQAVGGKPPFSRPEPIRALARLYDNYVQLVVRADSPVRTLADLRGRRVSTGAAGSGTELIALRLLGVAGIDPNRGIRRQRLDIDDAARALRSGRLDAFFFSGGLPTAAIADLANSGNIRLVDLGAFVAPMREHYGEFYSDRSIPASAYKGLARDVPTIGVPNYLVVNAAMDDRVAYALTKLLFDERAALARAHPEALRLNRRAAIATYPVPLHPGAEQYYRQAKI